MPVIIARAEVFEDFRESDFLHRDLVQHPLVALIHTCELHQLDVIVVAMVVQGLLVSDLETQITRHVSLLDMHVCMYSMYSIPTNIKVKI